MAAQHNHKPFEILKSHTGKAWANISSARDESRNKLQVLRSIDFFPETGSEDRDINVQIVVFGSLARGEMTPGSDLDWTLLLDGPANPEHLSLARRVGPVKSFVSGQTGT